MVVSTLYFDVCVCVGLRDVHVDIVTPLRSHAFGGRKKGHARNMHGWTGPSTCLHDTPFDLSNTDASLPQLSRDARRRGAQSIVYLFHVASREGRPAGLNSQSTTTYPFYMLSAKFPTDVHYSHSPMLCHAMPCQATSPDQSCPRPRAFLLSSRFTLIQRIRSAPSPQQRRHSLPHLSGVHKSSPPSYPNPPTHPRTSRRDVPNPQCLPALPAHLRSRRLLLVQL